MSEETTQEKENDVNDKAGSNQGEYKVGDKKPPKEHRFKKGQSGNPKGKPKGTLSVVAALKKKLQEIPDDPSNKERRSYLDILILKIIKKAITGEDVAMIKDIIDRVDGKPKQPIEADISLTSQAKEGAEKLNDLINDLTGETKETSKESTKVIPDRRETSK